MEQSDELRIALLGAPVVTIDGTPLAVDTRKATALLAYLAVTDRPVRRDVLTGLFWPEADPERARSALRRTLSTLRTALGGRWLTIDRETVTLDRDGVWLDVAELRRQIASCATHGHGLDETCPRCLAPLETAVGLDRGGFLEGFGLRDSAEFDDWQQLTTEELRRELAVALDRLAALLGARGDHPAAIAVARRRLALDPLHEPAHRELIRLLADAGDRASALEQYRECVRTLDRELGVRPLDQTTALYHAILEGAHTTPAPAKLLQEPESGAEARYALVGRDREVDVVRRSFESVGPDGRLLAIVGEAGIGKTRLCDELTSIASERGSRAATVRCFQEEAGLAFGVVMQLVRAALETTDGEDATDAWWRPEAARLLPELGAPPTTPLDSLAAQARFYEAICALVTDCVGGQGTGVVVVDDIHWADEASLGLIGYLVNRLRGRPLLVTLTWRPEEGASAHAIHGLLADARRGRSARVLPLGRLSQAEIGTLVRLAGQDEGLASQLHRESGGLPFFVVEYLDALARGEQLTGDWPMPGGVRELLGARVAALGELGGQVVAAAAVLGRSFDPDTVRDTSGRSDDETVTALEELVARGLLLEANDGAYDFRHEQARDLVYGEMTLARRRLLHRRAAAALGLRGRREERAASIADHLAAAGDDLAAAESYRLAGDRARRLYANVEAASHYRAALALGDPGVAELQTALGDLATLAGDYGSAMAAYETAAANADGPTLAQVEHRLGLLHMRRGAWDLADAALASAADRLPPEDRARVLADRSLVAHRRGDAAAAGSLAHDALALAEAGDDLPALAQAHNILGMLAGRSGDAGEAIAQMEQSLQLARRAGDREAEAAALNNLALVVSRDGETDQAIVLTTAALEVCIELGDRHREAALRNNLADLLHTSGRGDESMAELKLAVAIFAEIGEEGRLEPEIWKLTDW